METSAEKYIGMMLDDRYEIIELIGTGGMANVYKALCHKLNRYDAVKIMRDDAAANENFRMHFRAESKAIAMLSHPNIVSVYDVGYSGNTEYIVMELVDGITLKQYMQSNGPLQSEKVLDYTIQIAKALAHAHSKGIIHRDIKPQNVMLLKDDAIKVTDFGIAAQQSDSQESADETIGSVHYIAPEQARGKAADARSDIYSLGIVMYEMLTGRLPYVGSTEIEVAVKHMNTDAVAPHEIVPTVPAELERICLKAMATEISERYQSAAEMLEDLESFRRHSVKSKLAGGRIHSESLDDDELDDDSDRRAKGKKKKRRSMSSGIIAVLVLIILVFLFVIGYIVNDILSVPEKVKIPGFVGRYYEDVVNDTDYKAQFEFTLKFEMDEEHEYGIIISQTPIENSEAKPKSKDDKIPVELTVSTGLSEEDVQSGEEVIVPDVVNKEQKYAVSTLEREGFGYIIKEAPSLSITRGYVIGTSPAGGESAKKGDEIEITVSTGPETEMKQVPKLMGLSKDAAINKLESAGLAIGDISPVESQYDEGTVIWQSIEPGESVEAHTKIDIQISSGVSDGGT